MLLKLELNREELVLVTDGLRRWADADRKALSEHIALFKLAEDSPDTVSTRLYRRRSERLHKLADRLRKPGTPNAIKPDWQHKWSVDAHARMLVQRGTLPLDPLLKARLLKRRYTVYETRAGDDVQRALLERKHEPQREGQWLAVRRVWVQEHVSPNRADLPLIQGVKKVKRCS